jgi:hypothetical protein
MAVIPRSPPDVPDVEAYKAGRPASGLGAYSLAALPSHVLGVRALRAHGSQATIADWSGGDDANRGTGSPATLLRIPVRPSPLAAYLWLGVWYAAGAAASAITIKSTLRKDASLAVIDQTRQWSPPPTMRAGAQVGVIPGSIADTVPTVGLVAGRESLVSTAWLPIASADAGDVGPFDLATLTGVDLWVFVEVTNCIALAAHCVELATGAT